MVDSHTKGNGTSFGRVCHSIVADSEKTKPRLTEDDFCDSLFITHSVLENPDSGIKEIFCLCVPESRDLELGKRLKDTGISKKQLGSGIQVPLTKNLVSSIWNPEPKTVLDSFTWGAYNTVYSLSSTSHGQR